MSTKIFFRALLGLTEGWEVNDIRFVDGEVHIGINCIKRSFEIDGELCSSIYDFAPIRSWRHLDTLQYKTVINCRLPRVKTKDNKVVTINPPWAESHQRYTYIFESLVIKVLLMTQNQTNTAKLLRVGFNVVNKIIHNSTKRGMMRRDKTSQSYPYLSIDEKSFRKGHTYITVLSDPSTGNVVGVSEGRDKESCKKVINESLTVKQKYLVQGICTDMWRAYVSVSKEMLPQAELSHDRFHLIKYLNEAIDKVRKREQKDYFDELKNSRYALLKNPENLTQKQKVVFDKIQEGNYQVSKAWQVKENFKSLFRSKDYLAEPLLDCWINDSKSRQIKEVDKVVDMFKSHYSGVLSALTNNISNAMAERLNGKIQQLKTSARGYRTFENFKSAILFFHGGLDLYPIPNYH